MSKYRIRILQAASRDLERLDKPTDAVSFSV